MMESDEALFERVLAEDLVAFDRLYDRYERSLFGYARSQLRDDAEAEDAVQEAFVAVIRERKIEVRSFRAWLFQVAHNLCLNRVRSRQRTRSALEVLQREENGDSSLPDDTRLEDANRNATLWHAVCQLPQRLADVYRLRASGMSYEEAAVVLDVPVGTVKSRVHEMVVRLRKEMGR
jgi:RNA polymerase sigma-70 factor, ECF subfamily